MYHRRAGPATTITGFRSKKHGETLCSKQERRQNKSYSVKKTLGRCQHSAPTNFNKELQTTLARKIKARK